MIARIANSGPTGTAWQPDYGVENLGQADMPLNATGLALAILYCQARGMALSEVYSHIADNTQAEVIE